MYYLGHDKVGRSRQPVSQVFVTRDKRELPTLCIVIDEMSDLADDMR